MPGRMHGFQLWANLPVEPQDDPAALPGGEGRGHSRDHGRRRHPRAHRVRELLGQDRPRGRHRRRPHLPGCVGALRAAARPSGGDHPPRLRLRFRAEAGSSATPPAPWPCPPRPVGWLDTAPPAEADNRSLVLFDRGDELTVQAGEDGIRFLLVSGQPLEEPVAWYGPIVMNTQEQLRQAFRELREGRFLQPEPRG